MIEFTAACEVESEDADSVRGAQCVILLGVVVEPSVGYSVSLIIELEWNERTGRDVPC
jgi:hypothetical protein